MEISMGHWWNHIGGENRSTRRKTCASATLSNNTLHGLTWDRERTAVLQAGDEQPETWHS
jgi:hypothetical protein